MIETYYGKIGDGKTYHVMLRSILPALRAGRRLYTNVDGLQLDLIADHIGVERGSLMVSQWRTAKEIREAMTLDVDDVDGRSLKIDRKSLCVIDEAQLVWDAREFKKTGKDSNTFFEMHRHFGLDIVLVTQSPARMDKAIRELSGMFYQVKNMGFLSKFLGGQYMVNARQKINDPIVYSDRGSFKPDVFRLYRSAVSLSKTKRAVSIPMGWGMILVLCGSVAYAGVTMAHYGGMPLFAGHMPGGKPKNENAAARAFGVVSSPGVAMVHSPARPDAGRVVVASGDAPSYDVNGAYEIPAGSVCRWEDRTSHLYFKMGREKPEVQIAKVKVKVCQRL